MRRTAATNRESDKFILRLPTGMRKRLAKVAERHALSMNAVVIAALTTHLENEEAPGQSGLTDSNREILDQLTRQHVELVELLLEEKNKTIATTPGLKDLEDRLQRKLDEIDAEKIGTDEIARPIEKRKLK